LVNENLLGKNLGMENVYINEPMYKHTSFKVGGNADIFVKIKSIENLKYILNFAKNQEISLFVLGNGSNILVTDRGIRGIVCKIEIKKFEIVEDGENIFVTIGAGNKNPEIAQKLLKEELTGFEFASGIPGTIGGAIKMNAGAYGSEMKDIVYSTTYMERDGNIKQIKLTEHEFGYRKSIFSNKEYIILETALKLKRGRKEEIESKMQEYLKSRREKQPCDKPSAGSTFKRGENYITAKLIDECGLKGKRVGDAVVSEKHAGFIVNNGNATAKDILELIDFVKNEVYNKSGKRIELEIEIIGE